MPDEQKPAPSPRVLRRLIGEYRAEPALTTLTVIVAAAASGAELLPPLFIREALNYFETWERANRPVTLFVWPFVLLIVLTAVIQNLIRFAQTVGRTELSTRLGNRFRERMYEAIQRHSLRFHKKTTTGELISRSTRDIQNMTGFVNFVLFGIMDLVIFLAGAIGVLLWIRPAFAFIALSPVPLAVFLMFRFGRQMQGMWKEASDTYSKITTVLQENISGARVVRAFAQEPAEEKKFAVRAEEYLRQIIFALRFWVLRMISSSVVFSLVMPIGLLYGSYAAVRGWIDIGDLVLCFLYMRPVEERLRHVIGFAETYQNAAAGSERVYEILDEEPAIRSAPGAGPMPKPPYGRGARVEFRNVSFGYEPDKPVLHDITLTVEPGQTVALVGHTGSGKSTLIGLIPRFHDATAGAVFVNGVDVRGIRLQALRQSVGIIFQETFLFSATVRENIGYGRPDASVGAVQAAAEAAQAHDFITKLDQGYDTVIGERGVTLSGGQAQRIAIARAVLLDPAVLLMDDAAASVDSETERQIRETMRAVSAGRTTFVIGHRISSVAHADRIFVLDHGRIAEQGTHAELVALGGIYSRICYEQFTGSSHAH